MNKISILKKACVCLSVFLCLFAIFLKLKDEITVSNTVNGRELPIYCVETDEKKIALTFDAAWGNEDTATILEILKINLQISTDKLDTYLSGLISAAGEYIKTEGIALQDTPGDRNLVCMYAAYLYRKRREDGPMPRSLRWALNNRLFSQKAGG